MVASIGILMTKIVMVDSIAVTMGVIIIQEKDRDVFLLNGSVKNIYNKNIQENMRALYEKDKK